MKIIDIFVKIANGEEVPKVIEYQGTFYYFNGIDYVLYIDENIDYCSDDCLTRYINVYMLNDKVEIIEEEKKIEFEDIEGFNISYKLDFVDYKNIEVLKNYLNKDFQTIYDTLDLLIKNQKKLIDEVKKLKGDKNEK